MPESAIHHVGLDIGKDLLQYDINEFLKGTCKNDSKGFVELIALLKQQPGSRVVCEPTGGYERGLIAALAGAGIEVCLTHPGRVRSFARAEGLFAKSDRIDAALLRRFGEKMQPRVFVQSSESATKLRELLDHRHQLDVQRVEVEGRLPLAGKYMRKLLLEQQAFLIKQLAKVDALIDKCVSDDSDLHPKSERLQQMSGVGRILSASILAYLPEIGTVSSAEIAALVGVAPYVRSSGKFIGKSRIRGGRDKIRAILFMAAKCAARFNPVLEPFYKRLIKKGKPVKVCLVAVMRRMICTLNKMIADPNFSLVS
jgi:transposase